MPYYDCWSDDVKDKEQKIHAANIAEAAEQYCEDNFGSEHSHIIVYVRIPNKTVYRVRVTCMVEPQFYADTPQKVKEG